LLRPKRDPSTARPDPEIDRTDLREEKGVGTLRSG
jgi:hypothetical protein